MSAPVLDRQVDCHGKVEVYLPLPYKWFPFNLRIDLRGVALEPGVPGGTYITVDAAIDLSTQRLSSINPMFIRDGEISRTKWLLCGSCLRKV
jgi:hypothetical protein